MRRICVFFVALLSATAAFADDQWLELKSPNFQLITDGGEGRGRAVLQRFEQMRAGFGVLFNKLKINSSVPLTIVAFRSSKEMKRYGPMFQGKPVDDAGFFQMAQDRNFIAIDLSAPWDYWGETVFHEYAHLLINSNLRALPAWFDEGYAEYCSSLVVEGKFLKLGLPVGKDVDQLRDNRWMPITDLLSVTHDSRDYNENEGNRRSVFYAESWLLVHYLIGQKQISRADTFIKLRDEQHVPMDEAIQQAFGSSPDALMKQLQEYFNGRVHYFQAPAPAGIEHIEVQSRHLPELEAQATLADLHYHQRDHHGEGVAEFEQILKQQPDNPIANRELGYAYLNKRDYARASQLFQRAAEKGSDDARLHFFTALLLAREASTVEASSGTGQFMLSRTDSTNIGRIIKEARRAVELDAGYADAWNLLGYAQSVQGSLGDAIASTARAVELAPRNDAFRFNLASLLLQAKRYDDAGKVVAELKTSKDASVAAQAAKMADFLDRIKQTEQ